MNRYRLPLFRGLSRCPIFIGFTALLLTMGGCASVSHPTPGDPFESVNRKIYKFNDTLDRTVLKPVAKGYQKVVPQFARTGVSNFFGNLGDAYTMANDYLQGKVTDGTEDLMRVAMNSVFGIGGLLDFASTVGLPKHYQDFGLTLGHYGVKPGPYLVLPLLGPSTVRDGIGKVADTFADPVNYLRPEVLPVTLNGLRLLNTRASLLEASNLLQTAALDPYSFVRNAYLQRRQYQITGNAALPVYNDPDSGVDSPSSPAASQ